MQIKNKNYWSNLEMFYCKSMLNNIYSNDWKSYFKCVAYVSLIFMISLGIKMSGLSVYWTFFTKLELLVVRIEVGLPISANLGIYFHE
jgi:hypothetical protein